ncbi:unnamed protein product [Phytomonas sp. Hart1]|nr:unnamed protein product [Phytomonas sp. Hart1]|eukprot:CCW68061.1 unnamed protein product [Phytomonas sp. isolate Hart1]
MNSLRSPVWSVYNGEGDPFDVNGAEGHKPYVPFVSEVPPFLMLRSSGLEKEGLIRYGAQSAVYAAYDTRHSPTAAPESSRPFRRPQVAVKRLFTQQNDFGIRGIAETALREVALLRLIKQKQDECLGSTTPLHPRLDLDESPHNGSSAASFSFSRTPAMPLLDSTACILNLYRVVEAPHKELCLVMELCAMDLSQVVISHTKKLTACRDLDLACAFSPPPLVVSGGKARADPSLRPEPGTIHQIDRKRCPILSQLSVVRYLLRRLLRMVSFIHDECGILHRDLKLSNILITSEGDLRLSDFGSARFRMPGPANPPAAPRVAEMSYTPATMRTTKIYQSPECLLGDCLYSTAMDMWSVGIIFGELIRQSHLFHGDSELAVLGEIWVLLGVPPTGEARSTSHALYAAASSTPPPELREDPRPSGDPLSGVPADARLRAKFPPTALPEDGFDLLRRFLCLDPPRRISAREALHHPFLAFKGDAAEDEAGERCWREKVVEALKNMRESVRVQMPVLAEDSDDDAYDVIPNFAINLS